MAVGRDTTLSIPSSTRREDQAATTRCHSRSLLSLAIVLVSISLVMNYIVVKFVLLLPVVNYIVDLMMCVMLVFVEVVLRHFHRSRYRSSPAVVLLLEGALVS
jgi:membrane protein YdbS with pleckstrin-like domain